jgi:gamma-glutamyltranspeptidase/glutathione hydrolase
MPVPSTRSYRTLPTHGTKLYPRVFGRRGAVASEHTLSALAGIEILQAGGNAIDAAMAATLVEGVVNPQMHTIGGECPILVHQAGTGRVVCINGNMVAPGAATPEAFRARGLTTIPPEGILAAGVPGAFGAMIEALLRFGKLPFAHIIAPALSLARFGFPLHTGLLRQQFFGVAALADKFRTQWPGSAAVYLHDGAVPEEGATIFNPALADTFQYLADASRTGSRNEGLRAAFRAFYQGDVAQAIAAYAAERDGLLNFDDMSRFTVPVEGTASIEFGGAILHKCGPWNQGPALLQALSILKNFDLHGMGHNSAAYLHTVIEAVKLAWADREQFYADPDFIRVPIDTMLSDAYGAKRAILVDEAASLAMRPGDPWRDGALLPEDERLGGKAWGAGTVHVDAMDQAGNACAATPSGAWIRHAEVVPALGFPLGTRLSNCQLAQGFPNVVAPYKRPRTTISPSLAMKGDQPWLAFGGMGGDQQDQWQLQFYLNRCVFDMTLQQAIEAPKFSSEHFPAQFHPHEWALNRVRIEPDVGAETLAGLRQAGHDLDVGPSWTEGFLCATERNPHSGMLEAGCDPRGVRCDIFPAAALAY